MIPSKFTVFHRIQDSTLDRGNRVTLGKHAALMIAAMAAATGAEAEVPNMTSIPAFRDTREKRRIRSESVKGMREFHRFEDAMWAIFMSTKCHRGHEKPWLVR